MTFEDELNKAGFQTVKCLPKAGYKFNDWKTVDKEGFMKIAQLVKPPVICHEDMMDIIIGMKYSLDQEMFWFPYGSTVIAIQIQGE